MQLFLPVLVYVLLMVSSFVCLSVFHLSVYVLLFSSVLLQPLSGTLAAITRFDQHPGSDSAPGQLGAHQFLHVLVVFADFVFVLDTLARVALPDGCRHHAFLLGSDEHVSLRDGAHAVVASRVAALVAVLTCR